MSHNLLPLITVNPHRNYTGDRLNFGLACERAKLEGIKVELFTFSDDVAFYGEGRNIGRRGLAGVVLFNKIIGALAAQGVSLEQLQSESVSLNKRIGTLSVCLEACNIPGVGLSFELSSDELEIGLGIHGEPGIKRSKLLSSRETVKLILDMLLGSKSPLQDELKPNQGGKPVRIALVVNNLGGLSNFELNILAKDALEQLAERNFNVERVYVGAFVTAFSMPGVSLSLLHLDDRLVGLLDMPCDTAVWPSRPHNKPNTEPILQMNDKLEAEEDSFNFKDNDQYPFNRELFLAMITSACTELVNNEKKLNDLDKEGGDGDCGSTQRKGATAILESIKSNKFVGSFLQLASLCDSQMGGTSGAICSLLFTGISSVIRNLADTQEPVSYAIVWRDALKCGIEAISKYSLAQPGDRTMLETLHAVYLTLDDNANETNYKLLVEKVVRAAEEAAVKTASMQPKAGRASYVCESRINKPDPGAVAVAIWIKAAAKHFT